MSGFGSPGLHDTLIGPSQPKGGRGRKIVGVIGVGILVLVAIALAIPMAKNAGLLGGSAPSASDLQKAGLTKVSKTAIAKGDKGKPQAEAVLAPLLRAKGKDVVDDKRLKAASKAGQLQAWDGGGALRVYTGIESEKMVLATYPLKGGSRLYLVPVDVTADELALTKTAKTLTAGAQKLKDGGVITIAEEGESFRGWVVPHKKSKK